MAKVSAGVSVPRYEDNLEGSGEPRQASGSSSWHLGWRWGALGLVGSVLMALAGPLLTNHGTATWWFLVRIPPGRTGDTVAEYAGIVLLSAAWLGLGRHLSRQPLARPGELWVLGAIWSVPLALGPALFSSDMYSYLAQGTILHLGLDPYHVAPAVLAHLGRARVLDAVSPFWRHTTAPYGPLFLGIMSLLSALTGSHLVAGILLARAVELVGIALLAVYVPRLAASFGTDPCRATWLVVISPLVLVEFVSAGHNDALMAGLMVAGVTLARERHPLVAVELCALAATIKVPAEVAVLFIVVATARTLPTRAATARFCAAAVALAVALPAAVSVATGLGVGWISTTLLSTPGKVHLAITPVTAFAWTLARLAHDLGAMVSTKGLEAAFGDVALAGTAVLGAVLLWHARFDNFVAYLGVVLVAAAIGGPAAWPWYFSWGLVLLAASVCVQQSRWLPLVIAASVLLVKPDGILALPLQSSPVCAAAYLVLAVAVALRWWHRADRPAGPEAAGT